jgi:multiple sugar transport system permease protein
MFSPSIGALVRAPAVVRSIELHVQGDASCPSSPEHESLRKGSKPRAQPRWAGYLFVAPYVLLLIAVGIYPVGYALDLALTSFTAHFTGFRNFVGSFDNPFFVPALENVASFLAIWLSALVVLVVGLALVLHSMNKRVSGAFRFVFYLPAGLAGSASVMLWLFMLQPGKSPWSFLLTRLGYHSLGETLVSPNLPVVFALIAFWSGAGSWIVVMHGALATIPEEVLESAKLDGAGAWRTAIHVKLPLIKRWIAYMAIGAFAAGSQLFVEPELINETTGGVTNQNWSPNQVAFGQAFRIGNFNYAAAISIDLLVAALICAALILLRTGLFEAGH